MMDTRTAWHLQVDAAKCDGHGICALCCPERVGLDEWGYALVSNDPITDHRTLARAARASAACPERALVLRTSYPGDTRETVDTRPPSHRR